LTTNPQRLDNDTQEREGRAGTASKLGIPADGGREKMLLIYAWNEFGEGGIMAPTQGEKEMKPEAVREVFGH